MVRIREQAESGRSQQLFFNATLFLSIFFSPRAQAGPRVAR